MTKPDPRMQPAFCGMRVLVGPKFEATLCHLVTLVPGVGQLWHFIKPRHGYVLAVLDVEGHTRYSVVQDVRALLRHYRLPVANLGLDPAQLFVVIGVDWAKEGADYSAAASGWDGPLSSLADIATTMGKAFGSKLPRHEFATSFGTEDCAICAMPEDHPIHEEEDD